MIKAASLKQLREVSEDLNTLRKAEQELFQQFIHIIQLTRQLQLRYDYMGCLLLQEDPRQCAPDFIEESVLNLYQHEIDTLRKHPQMDKLENLLDHYKGIGYTKISLLALGESPESLVGPSIATA
ncbi:MULTISPECIES: hypothetical protein [Pontibacillus]|uniref:Uncharacterized protein n=1 Tax=Pontibacillus chungwhensis TaxID=265426 RepID=A0ABY8V0A1_9BACI|nr:MULTISPECIES: hypothetical protein [Pontibacillus]MCD5325695.1 hypothetical protein [Pontibacillus sp. HN14]WIF98065.1 hypothetical protein QNI29_20450 [Pontibacillus chungwhensis]